MAPIYVRKRVSGRVVQIHDDSFDPELHEHVEAGEQPQPPPTPAQIATPAPTAEELAAMTRAAIEALPEYQAIPEEKRLGLRTKQNVIDTLMASRMEESVKAIAGMPTAVTLPEPAEDPGDPALGRKKLPSKK